jgi:Mitochondrial carrier protein
VFLEERKKVTKEHKNRLKMKKDNNNREPELPPFSPLFERKLPRRDWDSYSPPKFLLSPIAASIAETCTHPIDFVKTQLQTSSSKTKVWRAITENFKLHGITGFYSSLSPAIGRHLLYTTSMNLLNIPYSYISYTTD